MVLISSLTPDHLFRYFRYLMAIASKLNINYQAYLLIDDDFLA
ncbi:hypothetical protein [Aulosira sp. FACHB-615]|nr:hypothetical protein [Aulosira sp. FACHB-615]